MLVDHGQREGQERDLFFLYSTNVQEEICLHQGNTREVDKKPDSVSPPLSVGNLNVNIFMLDAIRNLYVQYIIFG